MTRGTPQQRRTQAGLKLAKALDRASDAATAFIKARVACQDDPRAGQPDDGVVLLRAQMREYSRYLDDTLGRQS